ncbi:hypothetical protein ACEOHC_003877 [Salmonella enterica]
MLFKWRYAETPGMGRPDTLTMGEVSIGEVYQSGNRCWRAICMLPDSDDRNEGNFIHEYTSKGRAVGELEKACARWLTKSGMWTMFGEGDTLPGNKPEQG